MLYDIQSEDISSIIQLGKLLFSDDESDAMDLDSIIKVFPVICYYLTSNENYFPIKLLTSLKYTVLDKYSFLNYVFYRFMKDEIDKFYNYFDFDFYDISDLKNLCLEIYNYLKENFDFINKIITESDDDKCEILFSIKNKEVGEQFVKDVGLKKQNILDYSSEEYWIYNDSNFQKLHYIFNFESKDVLDDFNKLKFEEDLIQDQISYSLIKTYINAFNLDSSNFSRKDEWKQYFDDDIFYEWMYGFGDDCLRINSGSSEKINAMKEFVRIYEILTLES